MLKNKSKDFDDEILSAITVFEKELKKDGNFGLAKTLHLRMKQSRIKNLANVYLTLGFEEI